MNNLDKIIESILADNLELFKLLTLDKFYVNKENYKEIKNELEKQYTQIYLCVKIIGYNTIDYKQGICNNKQEITIVYSSNLFDWIQLCIENKSWQIYEYITEIILYEYISTIVRECSFIVDFDNIKLYSDSIIKFIEYFINIDYFSKKDKIKYNRNDYFDPFIIIQELMDANKITKYNKHIFVKWLYIFYKIDSLKEIEKDIQESYPEYFDRIKHLLDFLSY